MGRMLKKGDSGTNDDEAAERPRRRRNVFRILIASFIIIVVGFALFRVSLRLKLRAKLHAIRAAGYPVTCAELDKWYAMPASAENAADYLIDAFSYYHELDGSQGRQLRSVAKRLQFATPTEPLSEETKALIIQYLTDNREALELLHKGAAIQHSRYPINLSRWVDTGLPHMANIYRGANLLVLEAAWHAENAESQLAGRAIISIFGLARSLSQQPTCVSQYVRLRYQGLAASTLEYVINKTNFTDEQLVNLGLALADAQDRTGIQCGIIGERCTGIDILTMPSIEMSQTIEYIREGLSPSRFGAFVRDLPSPLNTLLGALPFALCKFAGLADMEAINYLNLMDAYIKTTELPPHQRQDTVDAIAAELGAKSKFRILPSELLPAFPWLTTEDIRTIARLRTADVALAIQRYRLATGSLPDSLEELVPSYLDAVPKDPFDGKDLRYKKLDIGFVVYSVGEDGKDDGGVQVSPEETGLYIPTTDLTFIVQR